MNVLKKIGKLFKTNYDEGNYPNSSGEVNDLPSMTQPDESLTIPEIMHRYARGLPLGGVREGMYELSEDDDEQFAMPDLERMDLVEIQELKERTEKEVIRLRAKLQAEHSEMSLQEQKKLKALEELVAQRRVRRGPEYLSRAESELQDDDQHFLNDDGLDEDEKPNNPKTMRGLGQSPKSRRQAK